MAIDKFLVEASHIMMFARSVGDANPIYHDEEYAKKSDVGGTTIGVCSTNSEAEQRPTPIALVGEPSLTSVDTLVFKSTAKT